MRICSLVQLMVLLVVVLVLVNQLFWSRRPGLRSSSRLQQVSLAFDVGFNRLVNNQHTCCHSFPGFIASCLVYTLLTMTLPASTCTSTSTTSSRTFGDSFSLPTDSSRSPDNNVTSKMTSSSRTLGIVTDKVDTVGNVTSSLVSTKVFDPIQQLYQYHASLGCQTT